MAEETQAANAAPDAGESQQPDAIEIGNKRFRENENDEPEAKRPKFEGDSGGNNGATDTEVNVSNGATDGHGGTMAEAVESMKMSIDATPAAYEKRSRPKGEAPVKEECDPPE